MMKAMILAAGLGKRLMPLTQHTPKPLILIGKQSLIERNIFCLKQNGISEIIINVSYQGEMIIDYVSQKFPDLNISFSKEDELLGTGGAILNALPFFNEKPFVSIAHLSLFANFLLSVVSPTSSASPIRFLLSRSMSGRSPLIWSAALVIVPGSTTAL